MFKTKYIVRLDDACPTMDMLKWGKIESICDTYDIKPIVAVIPNNKDPMLEIDEENKDFWSLVRKWQEKGWHIALHGYDHVYVNKQRGIVPFNDDSEFAGLSKEEQYQKIKKGLEIFEHHQIKTHIWVAPSHSFDKNTLRALEKTSIEIVSDGIGIVPFYKYGFKWIPQQIWHFRSFSFGTWTGCFHPNVMQEEDFTELEKFIRDNKASFVDITNLKYKKFCILNQVFSLAYWNIRRIKNVIRK